jgi:hypothetical protein
MSVRGRPGRGSLLFVFVLASFCFFGGVRLTKKTTSSKERRGGADAIDDRARRPRERSNEAKEPDERPPSRVPFRRRV